MRARKGGARGGEDFGWNINKIVAVSPESPRGVAMAQCQWAMREQAAKLVDGLPD